MTVACVLAVSGSALAADDTPKGGVRTTVPLVKHEPCKAPMPVAQLRARYYTEPTDEFVKALGDVLSACHALFDARVGYIAVVFTAKPTDGAEEPVILHMLLKVDGLVIREVSALPGVRALSWVYLTDDEQDVPRIQIRSTAVENPLIGQIGPLIEAAAGGFPQRSSLTAGNPPPTFPVIAWRADDVQLPFKRATIAETDFVSQMVKEKGEPAKAKQVSADVEFSNVPPSYITVHAGIGWLGGFSGAKPAKIDDDKYISDPLNRVATIAGVALHLPFDSTTPTPTFKERLGLVVAGVVTPAGGWYIGPSYGWRGFSVTAGLASMWVHTTPADFKIGGSVKPNDSGDVDQLVFGKVRAWMIGGTYVFGQ